MIVMIQERKRRDHIKDSFTGLKDAVPSLQVDGEIAILQMTCWWITRRYSPLRGLTSSSCGGASAEAFFALRAKKELFTLFVLILVRPFLVFSSNLRNV